MNVCNKLECLSLAGFSSLVQYLLVRPEPIRVTIGLAPSLTYKDWKGFSGTNTLAYYEHQ
jgi:hypothetical protein